MSHSIISTPLIDLKGENLNLLKINLDPSENSTGSSIESGDVAKEHKISEESESVYFSHKNRNSKTLNIKSESQKFIEKKTKRGKKVKSCKEINSNEKKNKSAKYKLIINIFNEFKSCSPLYKEFPQFNIVEKKIKNNFYSSTCDLVSEIRNAFSQIFYSNASKHDFDNYNKTFILCELFEKIYKNYDNQILTKESKILSDTINKLKRELRQTSIIKNNGIERSNSGFVNQSAKTKFKFQFNDSDQNLPEMSVKRFKIEFAEKIQKLTNEQKKGILSIVSNNYVDKNPNMNAFEFDVNKISFNQLKQLEKYLDNCIKQNNNTNYSLEKEAIKNKLEKDEKENDIFKEDDLSSDLSDDEDEEED